MAATGRKPTPAGMINAADHKKSHDQIKKRQEAEAKLQVKAKLTAPKTLSPEARKEWRRVIKLYKSMEVPILNDLDVTALTMYCEATAIYKKAQETWSKYQAVVASNPNAQKILDKTFQTMERQSKIVTRMSEQLCLTPVGRARMGMMAVNDNEPDALTKFMNEED